MKKIISVLLLLSHTSLLFADTLTFNKIKGASMLIGCAALFALLLFMINFKNDHGL